jgi:hypothetical protein
MKNFRVQIRYHGYYADFTVKAEDTAKVLKNLSLTNWEKMR